MRMGFLPYPFNGCKSKPRRCMKKYYSLCGVLLSGRRAGLFRTVFHILIKVARTNYVLKGTYILKACSFYQQGQLILVLLRVWCKSEPWVESMLLILPRMWPLSALFMPLKIKTSESSMTKDSKLVYWNDWIKTLFDQNVAIGFSLFLFFCMLI